MSSAPNVHPSSHPLIMHKITQMRKAKLSPKYLNQLLKEVSLFLCYEATASLPLTDCEVTTSLGVESGRRLAERIGIVPILRGGLGMVEAMTEIVSNAQACAPPFRHEPRRLTVARLSGRCGTWGSTATRSRSCRSSTTTSCQSTSPSTRSSSSTLYQSQVPRGRGSSHLGI